MSVSRFSLVSILVAMVSLPLGVQAQTGPESEGGSYEAPTDTESDREVPESPTKLQKSSGISSRLTDINSQCRGADVYIVDCLAERLEVLERDMSGLVGFTDARRIFRDTAVQLRAVTQNNVDSDRPKARIQTRDGSFRSTRPLTPVDAAKKRQAIAQAVAIIAEAETQLLRSAETSARRSVQYQQIAAALGSNKVHLRSS